jgi:uncharacterized membrane protein YczE
MKKADQVRYRGKDVGQSGGNLVKKIRIIIRLFLGYALYALGIALTVEAKMGLAPWDVLHQGLSQTLGISFGMASIGVGILIVLLNVRLGERVGWGTIGNMIFIGLFLDLLFASGWLPSPQTIPFKVIQLIVGMFVIGLASYVYLGCGLGSGPRDGLMVALTKKTGKPVALIRNGIELSVLTVGYFLGGSIGVGTVITALGIGFAVQWTFRLLKFDVRAQKHRYVDQDLVWLKSRA